MSMVETGTYEAEKMEESVSFLPFDELKNQD